MTEPEKKQRDSTYDEYLLSQEWLLERAKEWLLKAPLISHDPGVPRYRSPFE